MGLIRWYLEEYKKIDPSRQHPSIWGKARAEFNALSSIERDSLVKQWNLFKERKERKKGIREVAEESPAPKIEIPEPEVKITNTWGGEEIPSDLRMDEIQPFLDLPKREREDQLRRWKESFNKPKRSIEPEFTPIEQLSLFENKKISALIKALRKVSNVR